MASLDDLNIPGLDQAQQVAENPTPSSQTNTFLSKYTAATRSQPGIGVLAGTSILRTANTVLYGGWKGGGNEQLKPMFHWGKDAETGLSKGHGYLFDHLDPRTMFRHPTQRIFEKDPAYDPFGVSSGANRILNFGLRHSPAVQKRLVESGLFDQGEVTAALDKKNPLHATEGGFLGKLTAGRKLDRLRGAGQLSKKVINMTKNTEQVISAGRNGEMLAQSARMGRMSYENALGLSSRGVLGRGVTAFRMGAQTDVAEFLNQGGIYGAEHSVETAALEGAGKFAGRAFFKGLDLSSKRATFAAGEYGMKATGQIVAGTAKEAAMKAALDEVAVKGLTGAAREAVIAGAEKGLTGAGIRAGAGALAGVGVEAGLGLADFWNPVGWLLMAKTVYDLTKTGGQLIKSFIIDPAAKLGKDAINSFKGSSTKGVMGMGFKDTPQTITNRQRGVAAIQNSRLNARSILGSEGGQMHAHFG